MGAVPEYGEFQGHSAGGVLPAGLSPKILAVTANYRGQIAITRGRNIAGKRRLLRGLGDAFAYQCRIGLGKGT
jgi:hypothetical protein